MAAETEASAQSSAVANQWVQWWIEASNWGLDNVGNPYVAFLLKLLLAIVIVWVLVVISKIIARFVTKRIQAHSIADDEYTKKVSLLIGNVIYYVLLIFSLLIWFEVLWFDFALILWGISFGIGFAFKEIFGNMVAGVMILTNDEFKLWDIIEIDSDDKYFGRIEEITIRHTIIRTLDLRRVIIPNLTLVSVPIRTFDSEELVRLETELSVHKNSDLTKVIQVVVDAVNALDFVKEKESTRCLIDGMYELGGVLIRTYFYFDPKGGRIIEMALSDVNKATYEALLKNDIIIDYPHTVITVDYKDTDLMSSLLYVVQQSKKL